MAFIPGVIASLLGSGAVPSLIETGAGLLKKVASTVLGERGGDIAGKVIDTGAGLLKGIAGGGDPVSSLVKAGTGLLQNVLAEPSAPALTATPGQMRMRARPIEDFASRMEFPEDVTTFQTTPAGRILAPDMKEAANMRTVIVPSPFMPRRMAGPRVAPHSAGTDAPEGDMSEDPSQGFRVLSQRGRMRHENLSAPRPRDAETAAEAARAPRRARKKKKGVVPPASFKRYFG